MTGCIAILGLGRMGSAMARRLAARGYGLVLWNRTASKARALAEELGAEVAVSPREAADACKFIHIVVSDDEASLEVLTGENGVATKLLSGKIVFNHTTVTPRHSIVADNIVSRASGVYVEAPVAGNPRNALEGSLIILCGSKAGEDVCSAKHLHDLGEVVYLGEPPKASAAKLAFNLSFLSIVAGLGEAFALAESYGLSAEHFAREVLGRTWLKAIVERYGERLWPGGRASFTAALAGKDARYAFEALTEAGLPGSVAAAVASYYSLMTLMGYGEEDYPSLAGFLANLTGNKRRNN
ncbi:MAG TPA: NAD(P)-dependent oxidoreductase [Pyrodictium delaneyi]|uniref:NAD(P)-dependent oxidoreductase n=1 Tax=Pyrodictium delaneyi TaxID=1273541 RepID=A0A832ZU75_9CREN|nr:NAD(P)-dependent oxidoreductase [Pyrodictium delaneyi]